VFSARPATHHVDPHVRYRPVLAQSPLPRSVLLISAPPSASMCAHPTPLSMLLCSSARKRLPHPGVLSTSLGAEDSSTVQPRSPAWVDPALPPHRCIRAASGARPSRRPPCALVPSPSPPLRLSRCLTIVRYVDGVAAHAAHRTSSPRGLAIPGVLRCGASLNASRFSFTRRGLVCSSYLPGVWRRPGGGKEVLCSGMPGVTEPARLCRCGFNFFLSVSWGEIHAGCFHVMFEHGPCARLDRARLGG
jgi:hypothetical protein